MKDRPALEPQDTTLARSLSEFDITMIGVGAMIGAGIFVLIGIAAGASGPAVMLALVLNGVVTLFTAMVYAELGSAIPEAGGGYLWVKSALGPLQSFLAGWMSWFSHAVAGALYAQGFGSFLEELLHQFNLSLPEVPVVGLDRWIGVGIVLVFLAINLRGASETGLAGNIITLAKVSVIGLFIAFGIAAIIGAPSESIERFDPMFPQGFGGAYIYTNKRTISIGLAYSIADAREYHKKPDEV
ncbi:MAG: APC family permease, partial [Nitriliruptorales bacterium]|nr:APC family permease [Nitriliruptorales bacterium]